MEFPTMNNGAHCAGCGARANDRATQHFPDCDYAN